jgi:DNA-binding CsgD family transcriptional regulator
MATADAESAAAMAGAAAVGDPAAELDAIRARVAALMAPQKRDDRLRLGTRAIELAAEARQPVAALFGHVWRIDAAYQLLDLDTVEAETVQISRLAESTRLPLVRWHLLRQQASRAALIGQFAFARDRSREAGHLALRMQDLSGAGMTYAFAIWLAIIRGDAAEVPEDFFEFAATYAPSFANVQAGLARALFAAGRIDEAQAVYDTLRRLPAADSKDTFRTIGALTQLIDLIPVFGDAEMARATYDLLQSHVNYAEAAGTGVVFVSGSLHWPLGKLAAFLGKTDQALEHFATAVSVHSRLGARPFIALSRLDWAETLRGQPASGALGQARVLAREAATEARRLDMPGHAERAERLARELDQSIATSNPLTKREREIAELISAGLTNRAIADRLVLSERTIESHVRSTLAKLQLTNRTELAAWALRDEG